MAYQHPYLQMLQSCIDLEQQEQSDRFRLDQQHSLKSLKAEGLALHPIRIQRKTFGYLDYPEIGFRLPFPAASQLFRDGAAIECFCTGEEPVKGVLLNMDGNAGEFRLFAPDFPEWLEEEGVGIKLAPDQHSSAQMKKALHAITVNPHLQDLFEQLHNNEAANATTIEYTNSVSSFFNQQLNPSQQAAIAAICHQAENSMLLVHGPPGTGKTTTLIEAIRQLARQGEKLVVAAPSNTAIDHLAKGLIAAGISVLRVGNSSKTDPVVFPHTPEGKMANSREQKEIKTMRIRAEEFRKMAMKYKRNFGKEEREQRQLLLKEVKQIRQSIRQLQQYQEEKWLWEAQVVLGTPIGLCDAGVEKTQFSHLIIDEAGQCLEPLAWCIFPLANRMVLAGDHLQLPPTVLSNEAVKKGFQRSILEVAMEHPFGTVLLDTQYRMRSAIAGFSSQYFYEGKLQTPAALQNLGIHVTFIDTAGSGFEETIGEDGMSVQNKGELDILQQLLEASAFDLNKTALITPYAGQAAAAKVIFPGELRISTIDSFQGQEQENILVSLVRSNEDGTIGFLKDYRRMNVAMTRAKEQLIVIGDSATIGADPFFGEFLSYVEQHGHYRTVWEFEMRAF